MITQPLLAATVKDFSIIKYPVIGSPKLDGIRCLIIDGKAVSRNFKEIPNRHIAKYLPTVAQNGMDGELLLRKISRPATPNKKKDPTDNTFEKETLEIEKFNRLAQNGMPQLIPFNYVSSEIMKHDGVPDFLYYVFDYVTDFTVSYQNRLKFLSNLVDNLSLNTQHIVKVPTILINNEEELSIHEQLCVNAGFEGLMIRSPDGVYKCGRSSLKEQILLKIKRFEDSEAIITGFEEKRSNQNEAEINVFGYTERSSKKEGIVLADTLGALHVKDIKTNQEFKIGTGLNDSIRKQIWDNKDSYLGCIIKYKYQPSGGKDLPRFPVFLGFRHESDM